MLPSYCTHLDILNAKCMPPDTNFLVIHSIHDLGIVRVDSRQSSPKFLVHDASAYWQYLCS